MILRSHALHNTQQRRHFSTRPLGPREFFQALHKRTPGLLKNLSNNGPGCLVHAILKGDSSNPEAGAFIHEMNHEKASQHLLEMTPKAQITLNILSFHCQSVAGQ